MFHRCNSKEEGKKLFRKLAKILHPDAGGETELMVLLQEVYDSFMEKSDFKEFKEKRKSEEKVAEKKFRPGKYKDIDFPLTVDDVNCNIFDEIFSFSMDNKRFDASFVHKIFDILTDKGYISSKQFSSILNIYYGFKMHEWIKRYEDHSEREGRNSREAIDGKD